MMEMNRYLVTTYDDQSGRIVEADHVQLGSQGQLLFFENGSENPIQLINSIFWHKCTRMDGGKSANSEP